MEVASLARLAEEGEKVSKAQGEQMNILTSRLDEVKESKETVQQEVSRVTSDNHDLVK